MNKLNKIPGSVILSLFLVILSCWGLLYSAKWLAAGYYADKVIEQRDLWESYGDIYFLEEWESALADINTAIALSDNKAEFYRLRGLLYEWRRVAPYPEDDSLNPMQQLRQTIEIQTRARRNALDSYRQSAALRPAWSLVWYKVAYLKGMLDEFDDEFFDAMARAYDYGKNLNFMQANLLENSLRFFDEIQTSDDLRERQVAHLVRSLSSGNIRANLNMLRRFRLTAEVCRQLGDEGYTLHNIAVRACEQELEQQEK